MSILAQDGRSFRRRIAHPTLVTLYDLWLAKRGDGIAMRRADLDPVEIPRLLPHLILSDVSEGGRAIRYRLVGTDIVTAHGFDYTGKTIDELTTGATVAFTQQLYGVVVAQRVPVYSEGSFRWAGKEHRWTMRLHLPMTRGGTEIDMVLAGQVFEQRKPGGEEIFQPATGEELVADYWSLGLGRPPPHPPPKGRGGLSEVSVRTQSESPLPLGGGLGWGGVALISARL